MSILTIRIVNIGRYTLSIVTVFMFVCYILACANYGIVNSNANKWNNLRVRPLWSWTTTSGKWWMPSLESLVTLSCVGTRQVFVGMVPQIGLRPLQILSKLSFTDNFIIRRYTSRTNDTVKWAVCTVHK